MTQKTPPTQNTASDITGLLKTRLNALLVPDDADPYATQATLASQAALLDCAFRHLASIGTTLTGADIPRIQTALKAQNQYRYTVRALETGKPAERPPAAEKIKT